MFTYCRILLLLIRNKMNYKTILIYLLLGVLIQEAKCLNKRCIRCRSRGELGSCGDPFPFNVTEPEVEMGIHVVACPSGWCGKSYEGNINAIKNDDYGAATERMCLQRPPSDYQERCAYTMWGHRKVYMCFCNGDLCNSAFKISKFPATVLISILLAFYNFWYL